MHPLREDRVELAAFLLVIAVYTTGLCLGLLIGWIVTR